MFGHGQESAGKRFKSLFGFCFAGVECEGVGTGIFPFGGRHDKGAAQIDFVPILEGQTGWIPVHSGSVIGQASVSSAHSGGAGTDTGEREASGKERYAE